APVAVLRLGAAGHALQTHVDLLAALEDPELAACRQVHLREAAAADALRAPRSRGRRVVFEVYAAAAGQVRAVGPVLRDVTVVLLVADGLVVLGIVDEAIVVDPL